MTEDIEMVAAAAIPQVRRVAPLVDSSIETVIGSASRPSGVPAAVMPPEALPGKLGLVAGLQTLFGSLRHGVDWVSAQREVHGDLYRGTFLDRHMVFIWDADEIHKALRNEGGAWSTGMGWDVLAFQGLEEKAGNIGSLLALDFDDHRAARALVQPAFTMRAVQGYLDTARRACDEAVPAWIARGRVPFKRDVRTLLAGVANEIFTGIEDPARVAVIDRALADFWRGMMALSRRSWLSPTFRRARRGYTTLRETFMALAPERRRSGGNGDLFSHMVCGADDQNDDAIVRVFLTIMFGAFDTTSVGVTSMAYLLARHPEWQERVRREALAVTGPLDGAALRSLKELEWVWKETLRLMPISGFVPRRTLRAVEVGGHTLPAGTLAGLMQGAIGRHPRWWTEPDRFDPERFSPERAEDKQHPALQMPFGAGAHACIGTQLATFEMKLLFHKLLTSCRFSLAKDYDARHTFTPMGCVSGKVDLRLEPLG
ncbi:MAG TPA: cytochrome P450 [Kofleriaceae bacterium]|nr:cytochrome P450 [Kofleriaceae bacterium]